MGVNSSNHNYRRLITPEVPPLLSTADHWFKADNDLYDNDVITTFNATRFVQAGGTNLFLSDSLSYIDFTGHRAYHTQLGTFSKLGSPTSAGLPNRITETSALYPIGNILADLSLNNTSESYEGVTLFCVRRTTNPTTTVARNGDTVWGYLRTIPEPLRAAGVLHSITFNDLTNSAALAIQVNYYQEGPGGTTVLVQELPSPISLTASGRTGPTPGDIAVEVIAVKPNLFNPAAQVPGIYITQNGLGSPGGLYHNPDSGANVSGYSVFNNPDPGNIVSDKTTTLRVNNQFPFPEDKRVRRTHYELIVFKRTLSQNQINTVETYLRSKYSLSY